MNQEELKPQAYYIEELEEGENVAEVETNNTTDMEKIAASLLKFNVLDEANNFLDGEEFFEIDPGEEKKLVRKIDYTILPFLAVCFVFFYVDKTTLSYALIFGMKEDLHLAGNQYSWLSSIFYFGYFAFSFPTNYMLLKFPVGKYLGINIFAWGAFLLLQAACKNFSGLALMRLLSGAGESCADPAFLLITSMYYTSSEQPLAIGKWYSFNGWGIAVGGLLGYGLGSIGGSLASWKYEFLVIGALCAIWGVVVFWFLPQNPMKASWFTDHEKKMIAYRIKKSQTGMETKVWKWYQVKDTFTDPKTYLFFLASVFANLPNGGFSNFGTIIVQGMGYSTLPTTLLQIPYGAYISLAILAAVYMNRYLNEKLNKNFRCILMIVFIIPNIAAAFGLYFIPQERKIGRLFCYYLTGSYNASFVLMLSVNTSNTAGHTKKVLTNAVFFLGYCVGNIAGPFFYKESQYPRYALGIGSVIFSHFMQVIIATTFYFYLRNENARRDRSQGGRPSIDHGLEDLTDRENLNFRYVY